MQYYRTTGGAGAAQAFRQLYGLPYRFGGTAPGPTDCSGAFEWAYAMVGVRLDRSTYTQYKEDPINDRAIPNQIGDGLFIPGTDAIGILPGHVAMYLRPGWVAQAEETGTFIGEFPFDTDNWEYRTRPALMLPFAPVPPKPVVMPKPEGTPTAADLKGGNLVKLKNVAQAQLAIRNGWATWYFSEKNKPPFVAQIAGEPRNTPLYAEAGYRKKR